MNRKLRIVSMAKYLPKKIQSSEIEVKFKIPKGWSEKYSGVKCRHWATH